MVKRTSETIIVRTWAKITVGSVKWFNQSAYHWRHRVIPLQKHLGIEVTESFIWMVGLSPCSCRHWMPRCWKWVEPLGSKKAWDSRSEWTIIFLCLQFALSCDWCLKAVFIACQTSMQIVWYVHGDTDCTGWHRILALSSGIRVIQVWIWAAT